jgi:hypothetical protein
MSDEIPQIPPAAVDRINCGLISDASEALARLQDRTGMKRADLVNRALVIYDFVDSETRAGRDIVIRSEDGEYRVRFL